MILWIHRSFLNLLNTRVEHFKSPTILFYTHWLIIFSIDPFASKRGTCMEHYLQEYQTLETYSEYFITLLDIFTHVPYQTSVTYFSQP
jgi:hypothetical protein